MEQIHGITLKDNADCARQEALRCRTGRIAAAVLAALLLALLLWPGALQSLKALCNRLFSLSESANSYVYDSFPVPDDTGITLAAVLIGVACAALLTLTFAVRSAVLPVAVAAALAGGQAYFGLALPAAGNLGLFGLLGAAVLLKRASWRGAAVFVACVLTVGLMTITLVPGPNARVEAASEQARDWLSSAFLTDGGEGTEAPDGMLETRHENRRQLDEGDEAALPGQTYELVTELEQEIALPHYTDYLRIALLLVLIPLVLIGPFLPFLWLNRQARKAAEKRAAFDDADNTVAIRAVFSVVIGYLDACGIGRVNALYAERLRGADVPEDYAQRYLAAAQIWQAAVYGGKPVADDQREAFVSLLDATEQLLYEQADRRTKLRLKYMACLHE